MSVNQDDLEWMIGFVEYAMDHTTSCHDRDDYNRMLFLKELILKNAE